MNERIDALFIEAMDAIPEHMEFNIPKEFAEKFAELIVRECADIADNQEDYLTAKIIKQQFGVEE